MTNPFPTATQSILVLGAGELGLPVLRNLARLAKEKPGSKVSVLLRQSTLDSQDAGKKRELGELRALGITWWRATWSRIPSPNWRRSSRDSIPSSAAPAWSLAGKPP